MKDKKRRQRDQKKSSRGRIFLSEEICLLLCGPGLAPPGLGRLDGLGVLDFMGEVAGVGAAELIGLAKLCHLEGDIGDPVALVSDFLKILQFHGDPCDLKVRDLSPLADVDFFVSHDVKY